MKKIVGKIKRYKYFFCIMLLIITQVFVCVELNKKQIETVSSYNGIDEGTSQILTYSDGNDLKNIIEKKEKLGTGLLPNKNSLPDSWVPPASLLIWYAPAYNILLEWCPPSF